MEKKRKGKTGSNAGRSKGRSRQATKKSGTKAGASPLSAAFYGLPEQSEQGRRRSPSRQQQPQDEGLFSDFYSGSHRPEAFYAPSRSQRASGSPLPRPSKAELQAVLRRRAFKRALKNARRRKHGQASGRIIAVLLSLTVLCLLILMIHFIRQDDAAADLQARGATNRPVAANGDLSQGQDLILPTGDLAPLTTADDVDSPLGTTLWQRGGVMKAALPTAPFLYNAQHTASALGVAVMGQDQILYTESADTPLSPASLAKLFCIDYALTLFRPDETVSVCQESLDLMKQDSTWAALIPGRYSISTLVAGMLIPSGNDAAYALADVCGARLNPQALNCEARIEAFIQGLQEHLRTAGFTATQIMDPSGFDDFSRSTVRDLLRVGERLMRVEWLRDLVGRLHYQVPMPGGYSENWTNTNAFLDPQSPFYNPNVHGLKTGTLDGASNLLTLYHSHHHDFLVLTLDSTSETDRYRDQQSLFRAIEVWFGPQP